MAHHEDDGVDEARRRATQARKEIDMRGRFTLPEATTTFRVLKTPPDKERRSPALYVENQYHRDVGPHKRFVRCGNLPGESGNCWLCRKKDKLQAKGRTKEAAKLNPIKMLAVQIAVLDKDLGEMVGPLLWEMNEGKRADALGYKIMGIISSPKSTKYLDHRKGFNFSIKRVGQKRDTKYTDLERDDESTKVPKQILKRLKPFADLDMRQYDEEYVKNAYYGTEPTNQKENEEDMPKAGKKKKTRRSEEASDSSDDESDASASDSSASDASDDASDDASGSDASGSDASDASDGSDASDESSSSDDASDEKPKKGKKGKKGKKAKDEDEDESDASGSDASDDASGSDASDEASDASDEASDEDEKPKKGKKGKKGKATRKPRGKGKKKK